VTSFGEEATQIGTAAALRDSDWVFPSYRQYGVAMYRGVPLTQMVSHLFGNTRDTAKGRQMPAHYTFKQYRFVSISSVIGTQIIHAVGCAIGQKIKKDTDISVTYFGDGATSSNDFHSGLNFAGVNQAPVLFFCVNNQYAISLPIHKQTAQTELYKKGEAYGVRSVCVDGNDVLAVYQATREAAELARAGQGPTYLELLTYRVGPHSSSDDPNRYRTATETENWKKNCPIERLKQQMMARNIWSEAEDVALWETLRQVLNEAIDAVKDDPQPELASLFDDVYAEMPDPLKHQQQDLLTHEAHLTLDAHGEFPL
jgi:TPP-dependent pyruvate/acetoin dehydrogenase alpha subunit